MKNNVTRMLDAEKIPYVKYEFSPSILSAPGVAEEVGLPVERVYKSLIVLKPDGKPCLIMMPGDRDLALKQLARAVGVKRLKMAPQKEAERVTGLQVGGISPLPLLKSRFPFYIDQRVREHDAICISAGVRGMNLLLPVEDLLRITGAQPVALEE